MASWPASSCRATRPRSRRRCRTAWTPWRLAPRRITIAEAISQPYLNGIYVPQYVNDTTFTISIKNVTGPIDSTTDPGLAIYSGRKSSSSGYSDVGGADMVITLGNWKFCLDAQGKLTPRVPSDSPQDDSLRVNVQAGTLMHELGHSLGLTHGGTYYTVGHPPTCRPTTPTANPTTRA